MSWNDSKDCCSLLGGDLIEARTQDDYDRAQSFWWDIEADIWLGGSDCEVEGEWRWESDAEPINMAYFWKSGQPNQDGNCLRLENDGIYDGSCSSTNYFVCFLG